MASKLNISCCSCELEEISKNAQKWCTICEEGFCGDCESFHKSMKLYKDHKMISIEDYRQIENFPVNLNCEIHGKKLDLYCKKHDIAVCVVCIPLEHKSCSSSDVISIDVASKNAKQSSALVDLEGTISTTIDNVTYCIKNREIALKRVDQDEQTIRKTITDTRQNLNEFLDKLERKLLLDLKSKHENCKSKAVKILNQLRQMETEVESMREQTLQMKRFASDLQVFLVTRQLNQALCKKIGSLKEEIRDYTNNNMEIEVNHVISSFMNKVKQFGEIRVNEAKVELQIKDAKTDQAQIQIHGLSQKIHNVNLKLKQKFDIIEPIRSCIVFHEDRIMISNKYGSSNKLVEYNINGTHIRDIPMPYEPSTLTVIDTHRLAVTYVQRDYLEIINTTGNITRKRVRCSDLIGGISYRDQKLYVFVSRQGIVVMDLNGKTLNTIDIKGFWMTISIITVTSDRIYYIENMRNTVHCCSMTGQEIWVFNSESISNPRGLSVDLDQNVFVVGETSNNLTLIQHDGNDSKVLLTVRDGLESPSAVNYNNEKKIICLAYKVGSVALYQVS